MKGSSCPRLNLPGSPIILDWVLCKIAVHLHILGFFAKFYGGRVDGVAAELRGCEDT